MIITAESIGVTQALYLSSYILWRVFITEIWTSSGVLAAINFSLAHINFGP